MTTAEIIDRLKQATADLLWASESDYPFEVMTWERGVEMTPTALFKELAAPNMAIKIISLADFFAPVLTTEDWYGAEELATVDRYANLAQTIESNLTEVQVFRLGEIEISVYIIGKTPDGDLIGLKTQAIET
jgi:Nuclease A inhibitor-like protein